VTEPVAALVIAIDGPSGSGKSSVSRAVARGLGLAYLDTGAMFRALTWWCLHEQVDLDDLEAVAEAARRLPLTMGTDPAAPSVQVGGVAVDEAIRRTEISSSEEAIAGLMRDSGDGAGDDQADTGTKNITREHEMALAANAREMLEQTERALERLDAGTYGLCENCGNPIGKARMQAFPRATLCVECKQKQERRS
jgi:RNA polymerase-binding protein DksA